MLRQLLLKARTRRGRRGRRRFRDRQSWMGGRRLRSGGRDGAASGSPSWWSTSAEARATVAACWDGAVIVAATWHARPCLQGLSPLSPLAGALWCSPPEAAICFIIAQSGGQGLHGVAAARAGAPAITSMIAARK